MNTQTTAILGMLLMVGLSAGASAATKATPTMERCQALESQFDTAKDSHKAAKEYQRALSSREKGAQECKAGDYSKGVASLKAALQDLGVKPVAHKT